MKKVGTAVVVVGITLFLGFAIIPGLLVNSQSKNAAENVLDYVIEGNFEKAFDSVHYYDKGSDVEPTISYEDAKTIWVNRVKSLKEDGVYIVGYSQLNVVLDDTYPTGTVNLIIMENGAEKVKEDVQLWFGKSKEGWKLGNLNYFYKNDVDETWETALSGNMIESEAGN